MKKGQNGVVRISFDRYQPPYVYAKYAVEVMASRKDVQDVRLNGKSVKWRKTNRGFISVSSQWKEGDLLEIVL